MKKKTRRANGDGSIYPVKSGGYKVAMTIHLPDGSLKRIYRNAKSNEQARMILHELKEQYRNPTFSKSMTTVSELAERWFKVNQPKWDVSTADNYRRAIDKRITPQLGQMLLVDVTAFTIEDWSSWMLQSCIGGRSQQQAFGALSAIFNYGVGRKIMDFNPCSVVPSPQYNAEEIFPFEDGEVKRILSETKSGPYGTLFQLAFTTGMRQGEIFGLQRQDYNAPAGTLFIRRQAREYKGILTIKSPKTKAGIRVISLTPETLRMLNEIDLPLKVDGHLFTSPTGSIIRRNNFRKRVWDKLLKDLGIKHRGFHHARHTVATAMLSSGVPPITVSGVLGHANVSTTLDIYGHYVPSTSTVAADAMSSIGVKFG